MGVLGSKISSLFQKHDPLLLLSVLFISAAGLITMNNFAIDSTFFDRQLIWVLVGALVYIFISSIDVRFLRRTTSIVSLYTASIFLLLLVFFIADPIQGAKSWFILGPIAFQPSDPIKLVVIALLAKYFSRRHVEIANFRHIFLSGAYVAIIFLLVLIQPDFGTAIIIFLTWLLMVLVSGISKKHLALVFGIGALAALSMWLFVFEEYQRDRIVTFLHPRTDIQGAGYNAYQSQVAVGSGQLFGKGIGYGTQSKLQFLPEYETDFIFAAFAEEWGFVGVLILLILYAIIIFRLIAFAWRAPTNFEAFFTMGVAALFMSHIAIHAGMNVGLLPVTGTTIPFMSYGGSHLMTEFLALGLIASMRQYSRGAHRRDLAQEVL
ncbi:MAG: rod shape-determining protein RodA [Patescibacteria group bacterium UBA2103]